MSQVLKWTMSSNTIFISIVFCILNSLCYPRSFFLQTSKPKLSAVMFWDFHTIEILAIDGAYPFQISLPNHLNYLSVHHVSSIKHMQEFQHAHWPWTRQLIPNSVES